MKKKIIDNDQKNEFTRVETDLEKDLRVDLETKLGDGELYDDEGVYYYRPFGKQLFEVDFDTSNIIKQEDFTTNEEDSDSDDPLTSRTDSVDESCPLSKNKKKKSANNMKKVEKQADVYSEEEDKKKSMVDEEEEDKTKDTVEEKKEDMKKEDVKTPEPPKIEDYAALIEDLVEKKVNEITKDIKAENERIKTEKISTLTDLLQKEPYGYTKEDLEGKKASELEDMKSIIEGSKLYKDFQEAQKKIEDPMDINKEIFDSVEDMNEPISDPWSGFKAKRGGN